MILKPLDDWNRPRCQEIGTYVDVDEDYQCAMTANHDGECDPLPIWPSAEELAAFEAQGPQGARAGLAGDIAALDAWNGAHPAPKPADEWADACSWTYVGHGADGLATFRVG